jgi:hypothetical protein
MLARSDAASSTLQKDAGNFSSRTTPILQEPLLIDN